VILIPNMSAPATLNSTSCPWGSESVPPPLNERFLKKKNHAAVVTIRAVYYDFARIYKTLRATPAMAACLSDHVWTLEEIVQMADASMPKSQKRGPYKTKNSSRDITTLTSSFSSISESRFHRF
jgi:hypothetical protein